jgi:uncharacterized cupredoxin-like copper-binding protein
VADSQLAAPKDSAIVCIEGSRLLHFFSLLTGIYFMETAQLIQAAASIASAMAATQYGKFGGMEASRIQDIAAISVKIAKAIEVEALKQT